MKTLVVEKSKIRANLEVIKEQAGKAQVIAVLKANAYGLGMREMAGLCREAGVPYQEFVSNNSIPCGSTIGPLTATRLGIRTIDVGIPLLSMHSAREMAGVNDPFQLSRAAEAFFAR